MGHSVACGNHYEVKHDQDVVVVVVSDASVLQASCPASDPSIPSNNIPQI